MNFLSILTDKSKITEVGFTSRRRLFFFLIARALNWGRHFFLNCFGVRLLLPLPSGLGFKCQGASILFSFGS